jgi:nitrate/TMAO reductase-like tetraheme cytochrome c subunit
VKSLYHFIKKSFRHLARATALTSILWAALFVVSSAIALGGFYWETRALDVAANTAAPAVESTVVANEGWGSEALEIIHDQAQQLSPIAFANACGLGASSCFRCHNDKRAKAPDYSPVESSWHAQHKSVNYSCTGCHKGNPRILKQEIAHKDLVVNAAAQPEKTCASCHSGDDTARLLSVYRTSHPRLFENVEGINP